MKKLILSLAVLVMAGGLFAQNHVMVNEAQMKELGFQEKFDQIVHEKGMPGNPAAKTIVPDPVIAPSPQGIQAVSPVELGRASNGFTILRQAQNQVWASDELNMVAFIHRQDVTIYGGGGTSNGKYRYDFSTDGGASFTSDIGELQTAYTNYGRYPNISVYNPSGNTNPFNATVAYMGPTNRFPTPGWIGHVYGTSDVVASNPPATTENYLFDPDPTLLPGALCEGASGEFWTVEFQYDGSNLMDSIVVYKGVYNSATGDIDWALNNKIDPGYDKGFDGSVSAVGPNISFSPDGSVGWIGILSDITGGDNDYMLSPVFIKTTDGGATWGTPSEVDLNAQSWVADSLQSLWITVDTLTGDTVPASDGRATTAFDYDLTVDGDGNPHLGVIVGTGGEGYTILSGLAKFMADVTSPDGGTTWEVKYLGAALAFRGEFGTPDPNDGSLLGMDNYCQASRDADGSHVFFSWIDNDTTITGFGESGNLAPNLRIAGLRTADGYQTCVRKITDGDFIWEGGALYPTLSPISLSDGSQYKLPIVMMEMITNNQLEPCKFWYFGNDATLDEAEFADPATLNLSAEGFCLGVGREELVQQNQIQLFQSFPNPATDEATIRFELVKGGNASLSMVNIYGQTVMNIAEGNYAQGRHEVKVNTSQLAPGVYFYNLRVGDQLLTNKMVITR